MAHAANYSASSDAELVAAINTANEDGDPSSTITLTADFVITSAAALPEVTKALTIDSGEFTLATQGNQSLKVGATGALTLTGKTAGTAAYGTGHGRLFMQGPGTATLTGVTGTYYGGLTVNDGTLRIDGGSQIVMGNSTLDGSVKMTGSAPSTLVISGLGTVVTARTGTGDIGSPAGTTMIIENGAVYDQGTSAFNLSFNVGGTRSTLNVDGAGSLFKGGSLNVVRGSGIINVTDGGKIETSSFIGGGYSGFLLGGVAALTVAGDNSSWQNTGNFLIHDGTLEVFDGGVVNTSILRLAAVNGSDDRNATIRVSGKGAELITTSTAANAFQIGGGTGTGAKKGALTIANGGKVTVAGGTGTINMATHAAAKAVLNIGGAEGEAATAAGTLSSGKIAFGPGTSVVNFNHTDATYGFDVGLEGNATLNHIGSGKTVLTTDQLAFTGITNVDAGTLAVNNTLGGTMNVNGGRLQGIGTVGTTTHKVGSVIAPGNSIGTLTINGDYIGEGGLVEIETVLGDDSSATDILKITGDTSGTANLKVINVGGAGAQTDAGIKIIDVDGQSDAVFALQGDYDFEGEQAVVGGAYAYRLYQNDIETAADGDWYLRSALASKEPLNPDTPLYQAGVPVYEAYAGALLSLNSVSTLQQRVGNRYWNGAGNALVVQKDGQNASTQNAAVNNEPVIWGRIEASHSKFEPKTSTSSTNYDLDTWKMQAGLDGQLYENDTGKLIGGMTVHYGTVSADARSVFGDGKISTDGYGIGSTLTWYGQNGFYLDGQAHATWYQSDLSSRTANIGLTNSNDAFGYALSIEGGQRYTLNQNWTLTPQAQLIYSSVDFDSFRDAFGTQVSLGKGDSLKTRLGMSADYQNAWQDADGKVARTNVYGIANLYHEFLDGTNVDVAGVNFASQNDRTWGGIGTGGSYNWANDKYSLYGEVSLNTSLANFGDSYSVNGTAGFRLAF